MIGHCGWRGQVLKEIMCLWKVQEQPWGLSFKVNVRVVSPLLSASSVSMTLWLNACALRQDHCFSVNSWRQQLSFSLLCKECNISFSHSFVYSFFLASAQENTTHPNVKETSEALRTRTTHFCKAEMLQDFICCHFGMAPRWITVTTCALRCSSILKLITTEWRYRTKRWE